MMTLCPLCLNRSSITQINGPDKRIFLCCDKCKLIFTTTQFSPTLKEEDKRNKQLNSGLSLPGYVKFLSQAIEPSLPLLSKNMNGLVYGCGPVPSLSNLLKQHDINCINYDPIFFPELPEGPYDFIFASECFENFFLPARELQTIKNLLRPGGLLIILTEKWGKAEAFSRWSFAKDPRHVTFYHAETFKFISKKFKFNLLESNNPKVIMMQKEQVEAEVCVAN